MLAQGEFAVTCEFTPPRGTDVDITVQIATQLKGKVDAVNVSDNHIANVRMSGLALCKITPGYGSGTDPANDNKG